MGRGNGRGRGNAAVKPGEEERSLEKRTTNRTQTREPAGGGSYAASLTNEPFVVDLHR